MNMKTMMAKTLLCTALLFGAAAGSAVMFPTTAAAQDAKSVVDQAKRAGTVGERIDGYLGVTDLSASAEIRAAVNDINIRRKDLYTNLARSKGVSPLAVAKLSGEKLVQQTPRGQMIMGEDLRWRKK